MKTLHTVDKETYKRIGKAYLVCSEYPEIFGDVKMEKFCGMFVDVIREDDDEREARMRTFVPEMYRILKDIYAWCKNNELDSEIEYDIWRVLKSIDGGDANDD